MSISIIIAFIYISIVLPFVFVIIFRLIWEADAIYNQRYYPWQMQNWFIRYYKWLWLAHESEADRIDRQRLEQTAFTQKRFSTLDKSLPNAIVALKTFAFNCQIVLLSLIHIGLTIWFSYTIATTFTTSFQHIVYALLILIPTYFILLVFIICKWYVIIWQAIFYILKLPALSYCLIYNHKKFFWIKHRRNISPAGRNWIYIIQSSQWQKAQIDFRINYYNNQYQCDFWIRSDQTMHLQLRSKDFSNLFTISIYEKLIKTYQCHPKINIAYDLDLDLMTIGPWKSAFPSNNINSLLI